MIRNFRYTVLTNRLTDFPAGRLRAAIKIPVDYDPGTANRDPTPTLARSRPNGLFSTRLKQVSDPGPCEPEVGIS